MKDDKPEYGNVLNYGFAQMQIGKEFTFFHSPLRRADIDFIKQSKLMQKLSASSRWSTWRPL